ncbi:MAG TPA: AAA family ATPase, partial [Actinomycetota bacterium]|nr:AAA family ATPase [Actinomycetota bacterium]
MQLIEREPALDALGGWFAEARAGRGRLVLIGGEAGVGKTTLVNEFSVRHRHAGRILWGACDALTTPRPHGPLADVAPALGGRLDQLLREAASREVLFSTLLHRLLDARVATVLVIEDVHWADEATLDLIRFLARRLQLAPLSRQGVAVLAGPHGVDPDALYETTGGNPFFITEVLAADDAAIPATVLDAVLARAARLSPPARKVLDAAAVVAPPVETWLLVEA